MGNAGNLTLTGAVVSLLVFGLNRAFSLRDQRRYAAAYLWAALAFVPSVGFLLFLASTGELPLTVQRIFIGVAGAAVGTLTLLFLGEFLRPTTNTEASSQPAALLVEWKWSKLPTSFPTSGIVWTMHIVSQLEAGGQPLLLSPRPGSPGDKLTWGEDTRQYGGVYRCDITNYADYPIFNLVMHFKTEFFKPEADGSRKAETPVSESYDRPITISKLDPKETFSFYAFSDSKMYVSVQLPMEVTYLRDEIGPRAAARLLPQADKTISLFPMTFIEQPKPAVQPPMSKPPSK